MDVFKRYAHTAVRIEAGKRLEYISDTSAAIAGLLSKKSDTKEYAKDIEKIYLGEGDGGRQTNSPNRRKG